MEKKVKKEKAKEPWIKAIKSWIIYAVVITIFVTVFMHDATISDDLGNACITRCSDGRSGA